MCLSLRVLCSGRVGCYRREVVVRSRKPTIRQYGHGGPTHEERAHPPSSATAGHPTNKSRSKRGETTRGWKRAPGRFVVRFEFGTASLRVQQGLCEAPWGDGSGKREAREKPRSTCPWTRHASGTKAEASGHGTRDDRIALTQNVITVALRS